MSQEHHEEFVWHVVVSGHALLFLGEVVGEGCFEVDGAGGQDDLVAVDWFAFHHQRDVAELGLVQNAQEVPGVGRREHIVERRSIQCLT